MNKSTACLVLPFIGVTSAIMFGACKKDSNTSPTPPSASIKDTIQTVNESVGTVNVTLNLDHPSNLTLKLNFTLSGSAILNGDYEVDSSSSITFPAGSTSATLKFTIFDDAIFETDKTIHVKFSSTGNVGLNNTDATITIKDNDVSRASTGLQTDLSWDAGTLVDLDLFAVNNVLIDTVTQTVTSFDLVDSSKHGKGFESVLIKNSSPDGYYYLMVRYVAGARIVNFALNFYTSSRSNFGFSSNFTSGEVGSARFVGPFLKIGSSFARQSGTIYDLSQVKHYVYRGKVK
jgi:hypothetical protein